MNIRRAVFAVPFWACAVVPAFAEQQEGVLGAGQKSCGDYLEAVMVYRRGVSGSI